MSIVIQVVQHLRPGGIETLALDLVSFANDADTTYLLALEGERESALATWPRLLPFSERLIFMEKTPGWRPGLIVQLRQLFRAKSADAVHTHHIGPLMYAGLAARLAGVRRLIHTEHDAWHLDDKRRRSLQRGAIAITRPTLVADADIVATAMRTHLRADMIHIVHNGIDTTRFRPGDPFAARRSLGLPQDVPLIGCAGRLEHVKGQQVLIEALARMPPDTHLALAGVGDNERRLRALAKRHGLERRIHFLGRIDDMPNFYQALDAFCLPSLNEGFPLAPLEAQACGIPSVVTDVGGAREALCALSGRLIPPNEPIQMATQLSRMLSADKGATGRHFVCRSFDVRHMAQAYALLRQGT